MHHEKQMERGIEKEINQKDGRRERGRAERKGMRMTQYGNKRFFSARQSIHLLKYCLIG